MRARRRFPFPLVAGITLLASAAALSAGAASAAPLVVGDTTPPKVYTQNFGPRAVDLAAGTKDVVITLTTTDETGVRTPTAGFRAVNTDESFGFGPMTRVSGTAQQTNWQRRITVPTSALRTWYVVVNPLVDTLGNAETQSHPDFSAMTGYNSSIPSAPTAPSALSGFPGNTMANIYCMGGPEWNGGSPITGYRVTATPGGMTMTGTSCNFLMKGLTNGVTYTFTVAAINARGASEESRPTAPMTARPAFRKTPPPVVTGVAKVAYTLTAAPGTWEPTPDQLTYRWGHLKDDGSGTATPIAGATSLTYKVKESDRGHRLAFEVTASKAGGYPTVTRAFWTTRVPLGLTVKPTPVVTGTAKVGSTLTATAGTWEPAPVTLTYRWYRVASTGSTSPISGATARSYTPVATDGGYRLQVVVTGSKAEYQTVLRPSAVTAAVAR